jgi:hypothetical protein
MRGDGMHLGKIAAGLRPGDHIVFMLRDEYIRALAHSD